MTGGPDFLADAADDLVAAATRFQRRRRTQRRAAAGAAAAMILATGALIGLGALRSNDASAERVIVTTAAGGFQTVTIDLAAPAAEIIDDLQNAGIKVDSDEVLVGPSRVGEATSISASGDQIAEGVYRIPTGSPIRVEVGVLAPPGVEYEQPSIDVFADGEPLHCLGATGVDAAALAKRIPPDIDVSWFRGLGNSAPITEDDLDGTVVDQAFSTKANTVSINVVAGPDPTEPPAC